ncbi:MAG: stress response translation initiation inhibitor YciH [Candidatus Omnitrophica bacterium]|nr:stress response translation initiation inhibitor YciH [Candidatus Omnitrophota bacterium]MDD5770660.1 stress response translation initiation inhibitor YciH [Candidatus Omnitrophota bacterium]
MPGFGLVYSTSRGAICPECGQAVGCCVCKKTKSAAVSHAGGVRLRYEKGRKGNGMTFISGLLLNEEELLELAGRLKRCFGTGGSVKEGVIELQGDLRLRAGDELRKRGFVK